MALQKIDALALGRAQLTDNSDAAILFSANNLIQTWSSLTSYAQYNVVEWNSRIYRSKIASNLNNQPDLNPSDWETMYVSPKDGDIAVVINGSGSTVLQRKGGIWAALVAAPITVSLVDGQVSPAPAFVFLGSTLTFAKVEYTLARSVSAGRSRKGTFNVQNDGVVTTVDYDHAFTEIGSDVNATLTWDFSGANVRLMYTSGAEGVPLTLKYTLGGWDVV